MSETQTVEDPIEENPINDLINHSLNQDYNKANEIFGNILGQKLDIALEQEKIKMADLVYNGDEEEEELEDDTEELEELEDEGLGSAEEELEDDDESSEDSEEDEIDDQEEIADEQKDV